MNTTTDVLNSFKRSQYAKPVAVYAGVLAGLDLVWLLAFARASDQLIAAGLGLVLFAVAAWRAQRSGVVIQRSDRVVVREIGWTHRLLRTRVKRFTVEAGRLSWRVGGNFLVAETTDGRLRSFRDFNAPPTDAGRSDLNSVAMALNTAWHLG